MIRLQLTLRSGAQIEVEVGDWSVTKSLGGKGCLSNLKWETPQDATRRLVSVELEEVVAVVEIRDPGERT